MLRAVQQRRFHARIKSRRLSFETSRRAGLEFVCIFGHDEDGELLAKSDILESQLATSLKVETRARTNDEIMPAWSRQTGD